MNEQEWYDRMNQHPAVRVHRGGEGRGSCANCRHTGVPGQGGYGMEGVSGYWCRNHAVPASGDRTCNSWVPDR